MGGIYLDHAATTFVLPEVREAMARHLEERVGNPSSIHEFGRRAKATLEDAREAVAALIGASPAELVFTSGGTEADNAALIGAVLALRDRGRHVVTTAIEHHAVLHTARQLQDWGFDVTYVHPGPQGVVKAEDVAGAIRPDTVLVSVMWVNNETGAVQPVREIGALVKERGLLFHTDAVQAVPWLPVEVDDIGCDLLSVSAHKLHGPQGIGALFVRKGTPWVPLLYGGAQERGRRAGTENVPGIVGFGAAAAWIKGRRAAGLDHAERLRKIFLGTVREEFGQVLVHSPEDGIPAILNVAFPGVSAETLLMNLDLHGIAASSGSACTSGSLEPSHVLQAMGLEDAVVRSSLRFSFSIQTTEEEVREAGRAVGRIARRLVRPGGHG
ncbi:cysteine desulfurase family protein [Kyrpidia tusciae]|uniref:cysteine desulfurase n=1 Tax=Kyrpidia tusciae (strain DSM 2912 / NBRC 15312 / T2) TaxID=562970 RepID=D5WWY1_KYRT2|nr:cysteine desulfurase family protein [Kyrpidia tusciae]ADG05832.1 Cysteine desulfurase [Kyrpidia tusciae DSM 2912]